MMLRVYFVQQWFNLSDPGLEEALYDSVSMRRFAGIDLGEMPVPDESTVLRFRHLLEAHALGEKLFQQVHVYLERQGLKKVTATPANVHDSVCLPDLLHGEETRVWGDSAYQGQTEVIRKHAPKAMDFTNRRYRYKDTVDEEERVKNKTKSRVRAKVEHPFLIIKCIFGFVKTRYKGLAKNAHRLFVACALANLYLMRRRLWRLSRA